MPAVIPTPEMQTTTIQTRQYKTPASNPRKQPHLHPIRRRTSKRQLFPPNPPISVLNSSKNLHQPHNSITRLRKRKLLANTDTLPAVEREIAPAGAEIGGGVPALGAEEVGVGAVDGGQPVHGVGAVGDDHAGGDVDGGGARGAAAGGEDGWAEGEARVAGDDGVEAEGWVVLVGFLFRGRELGSQSLMRNRGRDRVVEEKGGRGVTYILSTHSSNTSSLSTSHNQVFPHPTPPLPH